MKIQLTLTIDPAAAVGIVETLCRYHDSDIHDLRLALDGFDVTVQPRRDDQARDAITERIVEWDSTETGPLSHPCTSCGADRGQSCHSTSGNTVAYYHRPRVRAFDQGRRDR